MEIDEASIKSCRELSAAFVERTVHAHSGRRARLCLFLLMSLVRMRQILRESFAGVVGESVSFPVRLQESRGGGAMQPPFAWATGPSLAAEKSSA